MTFDAIVDVVFSLLLSGKLEDKLKELLTEGLSDVFLDCELGLFRHHSRLLRVALDVTAIAHICPIKLFSQFMTLWALACFLNRLILLLLLYLCNVAKVNLFLLLSVSKVVISFTITNSPVSL